MKQPDMFNSEFGSYFDDGANTEGKAQQGEASRLGPSSLSDDALPEQPVKPVPGSDPRMSKFTEEIKRNGGEWEEPEEYRGSVGKTMFDLPNSKDNLLTVLIPRKHIGKVSSQSLVEIRSRKDGDGRVYRGIVVEGPFYEPDGLRADSTLLVVTTAHGQTFVPKYHARVVVEVLHELVNDRSFPPLYRPLPNSPVFALDNTTTAEVLNISGEDKDVVLGVVVGHDELEVRFSSTRKSVLPRHTGILGTTGGGKSTTVSNQVHELQKAGVAVVLIDTEGEYACINEPTEDKNMLAALERRGKAPSGVKNTRLYHLVGREASNPKHPDRRTFSLPFDQLSPEMVMEVLELTPAQQEAYHKAYEITRTLVLALGLYGRTEEEKKVLMELDELEKGFPKMRLSMVRDVVEVCAKMIAKELDDEEKPAIRRFYTREFADNKSLVISEVQKANPKNAQSDRRSWFKLLGALNRLQRLGIFDNKGAKPLDFNELTEPGRVSIIDLGDTDSPQVNNLVIAELLRGVLEQQNTNYEKAQSGEAEMRRVVVVIEEAHEFLSAQRIKQMPTLAAQVNRIARRGRKRWLGLMFVTQLPQHLPDEVLGLINNYILHKISDTSVISRLKRSVGGIDESLWLRLSDLAAGQAIVRMEGMTRPLLVAMDPTPCKLLMVD
ncbi:MAG: hypothetical protein KatS3mg043_0330 [Rhodothermaceae bacterium]|nr:MAG: hypothetical protein KatS3mg043_0330 [Rhodothermaceae bacterium]